MSAPAPPEHAVTLTYVNRPIVEFRAQVLARMPADRAATAVRTLDDLVARDVLAPVTVRRIAGAAVLTVGNEAVFAIVAADVDALIGETVDGQAALAAERLQAALSEAAELRAPRRVLRGVAEAAAVTAVLVALLWLLWRSERAATRHLRAAAERRIARGVSGQLMRVTHLPRALSLVASAFIAAPAFALIYLWLAFVLRRFPYTRPWGESLRSILLARLSSVGSALVEAVPGLCAVVLILLAARVAAKAVGLVFTAVEEGRISMPGVYPDTALATRRLATALVWLFAIAIAHPYVPGSDSLGFKGISVFVGVIVSLGSTGIVQHLMSGMMLTFARAVHPGDFARLGDVEGTVLQIGALVTKVRTPYGEEITVPNGVAVSQMTTNYSIRSNGFPALLRATVSIGYDTPWRQVERLLLTAAQHTPGLGRTPPPRVCRDALEDYYVKYTLLVAPEDPCRRHETLDRLHARILDAFNEHGVQIMSPHYVSDPAEAKIVPPSRWYTAPASPPTEAATPPADFARRS